MTNLVKKNGLNFGIIVGVLSILATTIIYVIDIKMFVSFWVGIPLFLVNLIIGIIAVAKTKKGLNGFISFKEAFSVYFFALALGSLIGMVYTYLLFNIIDPSSKEVLMDAAVEKTVEMMQNFGAKTGDIKRTVEEMQLTDNFSIVSQLKSYLGSLVFTIVIGLIVAAAFKKNKPEFE